MQGKVFYKKIRQRRIEIDETQKEMAKRVGKSVSLIKALETGRTDTDQETLEKIAEFLDIELSEIYNSDFKETKVISILNNKGGVGKTSVCNSLAYTLSEQGYKILCIDGDGQRNLTDSFGVGRPDKHLGMAIEEEDDIRGYIERTKYENIDFVAADLSMTSINLVLFSKHFREVILKKIMRNLIEDGVYDFIFIDTNSNLDMLNFNVLNASDFVIIPVELSKFAVDGLENLMNYIHMVKTSNIKLEVAGILFNKYDLRKSVTKKNEELVNQHFKEYLFNTKIRLDVDIEKAQDEEIPVQIYNPDTRIVKEYQSLTKELLSIVNSK